RDLDALADAYVPDGVVAEPSQGPEHGASLRVEDRGLEHDAHDGAVAVRVAVAAVAVPLVRRPGVPVPGVVVRSGVLLVPERAVLGRHEGRGEALGVARLAGHAPQHLGVGVLDAAQVAAEAVLVEALA